MNYSGKKALIMGLGLHGGGLESARFMLKRGASVTVTDLRDEETLKPSIEKLDDICSELGCAPVRYVTGRHEIDDFKNADIVVKNPGVRPDSPFLKAAKKIETDISLFLAENPAGLFAVTGTKGKSGTAAALYHILQNTSGGVFAYASRDRKEYAAAQKAYLGGNITMSPLTFLDDLTVNDNVVLELSSFQLGDLKGRTNSDGSALLQPHTAIITPIMSDHLDRYASMEEYVNDKRVICRGQNHFNITIAPDDEWGCSFLAESGGRSILYTLDAEPQAWKMENCKWVIYNDDYKKLVPEKPLVPGLHQRINLYAAALAAFSCGIGIEADAIRASLENYRGIEHRLEFFYEAENIRFYNDSAATIPEAAAACVNALSHDAPLVLVTGGTDKNLDFSPLAEKAHKAAAIILLAGTGSEKIAKLLDEKGITFKGPFDNLEEAVNCAISKAESLRCSQPCANNQFINIALSPACASFGMFLNEFDRGNKWKEAVIKQLTRI